jgi:branched-chain amino acid transport system permease protein
VISQIAVVLFDGFAFGMLLFVLSVGLSVTLGLMNFINLAHGAFGMLGGYIAVTAMRQFGFPFLLTLPAAFVGAAVISILFERTLFRRLYRAGELNQVLFTIGLVFVAAAAAAYFFGTSQQPIQMPAFLRGSVEIGGMRFGAYRIFLIAMGLAITVLLVLGLERTRFGARVRASVDNQRVAQGLGLDVDTIFAITFALGSGLAGLGGALAIEIVGLDLRGRFLPWSGAAWHRRCRRKVLCSGDRLVPDLPPARRYSLRAAPRAVREAVTAAWRTRRILVSTTPG